MSVTYEVSTTPGDRIPPKWTVGEYGSIELGDESCFARAFSEGKEVAASLALARVLGARMVLGDLLALRASMLGVHTHGARAI